MKKNIGVLAVMERAIEQNRARGGAMGSPSDRDLRSVYAAVAELVEVTDIALGLVNGPTKA